MSLAFEALSWLGMAILLAVAFPQLILNYRRKSTEGVSWLTFALLLFGMGVLFVRSVLVTTDLIIRLNYGLGALVAALANLQFVYYRVLRKRLLKYK